MKNNNPLINSLGMIPLRPEHLWVCPSSIKPVSDGKSIEELNFSAEMKDGVVEFSVQGIIDHNEGLNTNIIIYDNKAPIFDEGCNAFLINASDVSSSIQPRLAPSRRRANAPGRLALLSWVVLRVGEYVSDRFGTEAIYIYGDSVYSLSAEYASLESNGMMIFSGEHIDCDKEFIKNNPSFFSPKQVKIVKNTII